MSAKVVTIEKNILKRNEFSAQENRELFRKNKVLAVNLLSSPGSGKTTLLVQTAKSLKSRLNLAVTVGDLQTEADALRIAEADVPVVQINTGTACHLDADMVKKSLCHIPVESTNILFIENVGNLVCPASFDLGENLKVVILGTTEGEEKPLKYPPIFQSAHCVCINKIDLLPYLDFNIAQCRENLKRICPNAEVFEFSSKTGEGLSRWFDWLIDRWKDVSMD
jgi:hydrogenase nickel incorporation protein HypB